MSNTYLLDTNVLIRTPDAMFRFEENDVLISEMVLRELDKLKTSQGEVGYNAREAIRQIYAVVGPEENTVNIKLKTGGCLSIVPDSFSYDLTPDDIIINTAKEKGAVLITADIAMYLKAKAEGCLAQIFSNENASDSTMNYTGRGECYLTEEAIGEMYTNGETYIPSDCEHTENEYFLLHNISNPQHTALGRVKGDKFVHARGDLHPKKITARNIGQKFALDALYSSYDDRPLAVLRGPAGCVDAETEFFNGVCWKKISEYKEGDKVLQFDSNTNEATLVYPNEYIKLPCDMMYHFETKYGLNQTLSPEHRVIYYPRDKQGRFKNAHEILCEDFVHLHNTKHRVFPIKTDFQYSGEGISLSDIEIKIMLMTICDGTFNKNYPQSNRCVVNLKKERKIEVARAILVEAGIHFTECKMANGYVRFSYDAPIREKTFSPLWYQCNAHQLKVVCDNVLQWDGNVSTGRLRFDTTDKNSADFIQFAFSAKGYRTSIHISNKDFVRVIKGKIYTRKSPVYHLTISQRSPFVCLCNDSRPDHTNTEITTVKPIDGFKYCFSVPAGKLVLRRNGCIFVTGNSAKTFLALAAGLQLVEDGVYNKILILRPNIKFDEDIGYLKGDEMEKITPLIRPCLDNLEAIIASSIEGTQYARDMVEKLFNEHIVEAEAMAYIRGRSIANCYIIVDEAQNSTPNQILGIVTRAGLNSKVVVTGDPDQIDNPRVDKKNNGLIYLCDKMLGSPLCSQIEFSPTECVRSKLAAEAAERLAIK